MILVDFVHVNSPGGIALSIEIIKFLNKNQHQNKVKILLDKRNCKKLKTGVIEKVIIKKSEISRYLFYKKNMNSFKSILCFGNVPPPLKTSKKVFVYFHNELLFNHSDVNFSVIQRIKFYIKKVYILNRGQNCNWIVQTEHIKELLLKKINKKIKILKYPIFSDITKFKTKRTENTYIYPTSNNPHKNNNRLINSFINAAKKTNAKLILKITLNQNDLNIDKSIIPDNLEIYFTGMLEYKILLEEYQKSKFLIYPSLRESFGLPLIEAVQSGCLILASNLNFVNELISPSYKFDPYDQNQITQKIIESTLNVKHKTPKIKVKNSINSIFSSLN